MKKILLILVVLLSLKISYSFAFTQKDIWIYFNFDKNLNSFPSDRIIKINYAKTLEGLKKGGIQEKVFFTEGKSGSALDLKEGTLFSLFVDVKGFPQEEGSLIFWIKPHQSIEKTHGFLFEGAWASFEIQIGGGRIGCYYTSDHSKSIWTGLKKFKEKWSNNWHLIVLAWKGKQRVLYFDGEKIAERNDVPLYGSKNYISPNWDIGFLRPCPGRPEPVGFINSAIDDFAVLKKMLSEEEVKKLWQQKEKNIIEVAGGGISVNVDRKSYVRGETINLEITPYIKGDRLDIYFVSEENKKSTKILSAECKKQKIRIDTSLVRPDIYRVKISVIKNGKEILSDEPLKIGINARRISEFPVGVDALETLSDKSLSEIKNWHLNLTSFGGGGGSIDTFYRRIDRLFTYGLVVQPCLNIHYHRALIPYLQHPEIYFKNGNGPVTQKAREELLQVMVLDDDYTFKIFSTSLGSPYSKVGEKAMEARLKDIIKKSKGHPGLYSIAFDDEYVLRSGTDRKTKKRYYGDYSKSAREFFENKTGLKPSFPPKEPEGTVFPDNLQYLKWKDVIGMPGDATTIALSRNYEKFTKIIHKLRPDILTTTWSGGEYGKEVDFIMDYAYPTIWQPNPGYECGQARLDYIFDRHRARQKVKNLKPVWGLTGWWSGDLEGKPNWCVDDFRLNTIMDLVKGAKGILWFTAYGSKKPLERGMPGAGIFSRYDLMNECKYWADFIYKYGSMFSHLKWKPSKKVAVLLSETNYAGYVHKYNMPIGFDRIYPAMRVAGIPVDLITDDYIKDGRLNQYKALCLFGFNYTTASLWKKINEFSKTPGKSVFCDKTTKLVPEKGLILDFDVFTTAPIKGRWGMDVLLATMDEQVNFIRKNILPALGEISDVKITGSNFVSPFYLYGGEGKFFALVNYNIFNSQKVSVSFNNLNGYIYDILLHKYIQGNKFTVKIGKGKWHPYLILPDKINKPAGEFKINNGNFNVDISVISESGKKIMAPIPIHIQFFSPDGKEVKEYEIYTSINPETGNKHIKFPFAKLMDKKGKWEVIITELLTEKAIKLKGENNE